MQFVHFEPDVTTVRPAFAATADSAPRDVAGSEAVELDDLRALFGHDQVGEEMHAAAEAADFLTAVRGQAGLNRRELAARLDVAPPRITEIERGDGRRGPSYDLIKRWGTACGVRIALSIQPLSDGRTVTTLVRRAGFAMMHVRLPAGEGLCLGRRRGRQLTVVPEHPALLALVNSAERVREEDFHEIDAGCPVLVPGGPADFGFALLRPVGDVPLQAAIVEVGPAVLEDAVPELGPGVP